MKVLVTGVAGFIGSNLTMALLNHGYDVVGLDDMSHGNALNMRGFVDHPAFRFVKGDVRQPRTVAGAAEGAKAIVHLAAYKIPRYSDALNTLRINGLGSDVVFNAAVRAGAKLVVASTSDVYGKNPLVPFVETADLVLGNPMVKRWSYAISKAYEEQLALAYCDRYGLDVVLLRLFGGYGPQQHLSWWGGPQSVFIDCALKGDEMPLHGDGSQTRCFTYIDDLVDGFVAAIERNAGEQRVFNVGQAREIAIVDLAKLIWLMVRGNEHPKIKPVPYNRLGKYEDVVRRVPDTSLAEKLLGFVAKVDLECGLDRTIRWQTSWRREFGFF